MHLTVADSGDRGQHHVEAIEPRPALKEVKSDYADQDKSDQSPENDF